MKSNFLFMLFLNDSLVDSVSVDNSYGFTQSIWFWVVLCISILIIALFVFYKLMTKPKNYIEVPKDWKQGDPKDMLQFTLRCSEKFKKNCQ